MDTFGKRLTECRKAENLSQKELAEAFVTSHTTILLMPLKNWLKF